jgi:hypothetical protein
MTKVWVLQQARCEALGRIEDALELAGIAADHICPCEGQAVPKGIRNAPRLRIERNVRRSAMVTTPMVFCSIWR